MATIRVSTTTMNYNYHIVHAPKLKQTTMFTPQEMDEIWIKGLFLNFDRNHNKGHEWWKIYLTYFYAKKE